MENTSCGDNCPLVKSGAIKSEKDCPNYIENWWQQGEGKKPTLVQDCAPRRTMLQTCDLGNTLFSVQVTLTELRNQVNTLCNIFSDLGRKVQDYPVQDSLDYEIQQPKKIEDA